MSYLITLTGVFFKFCMSLTVMVRNQNLVSMFFFYFSTFVFSLTELKKGDPLLFIYVFRIIVSPVISSNNLFSESIQTGPRYCHNRKVVLHTDDIVCV